MESGKGRAEQPLKVHTAHQQPAPSEVKKTKVPIRNKVIVALAVCAFLANGGFLIYVFWII
jgi:hypothetical protein